MSRSILSAYQFIEESKENLIIDVRSPAEFKQGHIPHAVNMPLFDNEERALVGTLYKQEGKQIAIEKGLEIVGPKMLSFVKFVQSHTSKRTVYVHCWRGGMRSSSVAWLLRMVGYEVLLLEGGYKSYRNFVLKKFEEKCRFLVLGGRTGSGKTALLNLLAEAGEQIIDLEQIAHHKGSAFGSIGESKQTSSEQFENNLCEQMLALDLKRNIWLEDESRFIGSCIIPLSFWEQLRKAPLCVLHIPTAIRLEQLVKDYPEQFHTELATSIKQIEKRLGNEATTLALQKLEEKNYHAAAEITLSYYDKKYDEALTKKETKDIYHFHFDKDDKPFIIKKLVEYVQTRR